MNIEYLMKKYKLSRVEALEVNRILEEQSKQEFEESAEEIEKDDKVLIFQPPPFTKGDSTRGSIRGSTIGSSTSSSVKSQKWGSEKSFSSNSSYQSQFRTLARIMPWPFLIIEKSIK